MRPPGFLAAYNAGPNRYDEYRDRHQSLPSETVAYVAKLLPLLGSAGAVLATLEPIPGAIPWTQAPLFVRRSDGITAVDQTLSALPSISSQAAVPVRELSMIEPHSRGLFVALSAAGSAP